MSYPAQAEGLVNSTKGVVKALEDLEIRGREDTIQTTELMRSARIRRIVLKRLEET